MKRLGVLSIALAVLCGAVAVVSMHYAIVAVMLGMAFAFVGIGFLEMATDPRRKPNPRTVGMIGTAIEPIATGDDVTVDFGSGHVYRTPTSRDG